MEFRRGRFRSPGADGPAQAQSAPPEPAPASGDQDDTNLVPRRFQGDYAADTPACTTPAHESRLTIGAWRIKFHESSGAITAVEGGGRGGDITITTALTGEGETRQATYHFNLSDEGQTLTDNDSGMKRPRSLGTLVGAAQAPSYLVDGHLEQQQ